ncbi:L,D-transpeptidase family protein [Ruminococcus gauvreauii]|uniref:L,D-transpeptidase/peptidoglycan binding protein n=1 Tax=Ruminococcus gauvreauii TaxID=438033 RepID=A0ABY5VGH7_9FIRM|nr:L,D-transpeptidase family protein [Ruminococcus gauvreauii]UWP59362.1 L,D-transpeptidase/peptidoglycan binding protein [Ruminococcus gauvreauii]
MKVTGRKKKQVIVLIICLFLAVLLGISLIIYIRTIEKNTMGYRISVYGLDISKLPLEEAAEKIADEFAKTNVVFEENGNEVYKTTLKDLGYSLDMKHLQSELKGVKEQRAKQKGFLIKPKKDFEIKYTISRDEKQEAEALSASHFDSIERKDSVDAYITYDEEKGEFVIVDDVLGNQIDEAKLLEYVNSELETTFSQHLLNRTAKITVSDPVYKEGVTAENPELNSNLEALNQQLQQYRSTSVTYTFGEATEVLTSEQIASWLTVNDDNSISINEEAASAFVAELAANYNTIYLPRYFQTSYGNEIKISGNEYGFRIDQEAELQQLLEDLKSGTAVQRDPVYSKQGMTRNGKDDLAGSYIEVSLDNQHLWLYKNGSLVTETDIVSGLPTDERETYRGAWPIAYKASPFTLSSDIYGYEQKVTYWMPFVYGQGLHDADWQSAFGGDRYKTNGSHGCINLPPDQAKIIYDSIDGGYPIIIY